MGYYNIYTVFVISFSVIATVMELSLQGYEFEIVDISLLVAINKQAGINKNTSGYCFSLILVTKLCNFSEKKNF